MAPSTLFEKVTRSITEKYVLLAHRAPTRLIIEIAIIVAADLAAAADDIITRTGPDSRLF